MSANSGKQNLGRGSLSTPNVKLLSFHMKNATGAPSKNGLKCWKMTYNNKEHDFSTVWAQGEIIQINIDDESLVIRDEAGKILVVEAKLKSDTIEDLYVLENNQYVMVVGELIANTDLPTIRVQKLKTIKESKDQLAALWPLEVQHQLKYAKF